ASRDRAKPGQSHSLTSGSAPQDTDAKISVERARPMKSRRISISSTLAVCLAFFLARTSVAATFAVNSIVDKHDAHPGDGVCETAAGNGVCTLRAAVEEANGLPGADAVVVPAIPDYVLLLGELDITDDVTIAGAGGQPRGENRTRIDAYFYGRAVAI